MPKTQLLLTDGMRRPVSRTGCGVRSQVIDVLEAQIKRRPTMKKVSTVAAKPSKNISPQKLSTRLDLGDRNSWYCVLDESGRIQRKQSRIALEISLTFSTPTGHYTQNR
jgi:hypothetical protein